MHTISPVLVRQEFPRLVAKRIATLIVDAAAVLLAWQDRARDRHRLASLDDRLLRDIGLSRADVEGEISKHFWQG